MSNLKNKIKNKLKENTINEKTVSPDELKRNTDDLVKTAKDALDIDDTQAKDYVSGFIGEEGDGAVSRGIEAGMNPEVEADKYEAYRQLMQQLAAEEGNGEMNEEGGEQSNDPVKLKADVEKLMSKLDMSSIAPYLQKIDNPTEQAEVIAQFAEKIGVPKQKLTAVVSQLKTVAESKKPTMTKDKLIETVTGKKSRKVIKTVKVKDIK